MATLRLRGRRWFVRYLDGRGRRVERRTPFGRDEKGKAREYARKLEEQAHHARDGLEAAAERMTLDELWERYAPTAKRQRAWKDKAQRYRDHVSPVLGKMLIDRILPADVERVMADAQDKGLSPRTAEHLRVLIAAVYAWASRKLGVFRGANPARMADQPKLVPHTPRFLEAASIPLMLRAAPWRTVQGYPVRPLLATLVYTGMRKGEVLGLKPGDVDLLRGIIWVSRSYDLPTTKDGKAAPAAIPPELVPYLKQAMDECSGEWLFSRPDGSMMTPETKVEVWMRKALSKAGLVQGFWVVCANMGRRKGCGFRERQGIGGRLEGPCPECGKPLRATPIPLELSTKDLRSTFATHLVELTGDLDLAARQLRHSSPTLTAQRYRFARDRHLVEGVSRLSFENQAPNLAHRLPQKTTESAGEAPNQPKMH